MRRIIMIWLIRYDNNVHRDSWTKGQMASICASTSEWPLPTATFWIRCDTKSSRGHFSAGAKGDWELAIGQIWSVAHPHLVALNCHPVISILSLHVKIPAIFSARGKRIHVDMYIHTLNLWWDVCTCLIVLYTGDSAVTLWVRDRFMIELETICRFNGRSSFLFQSLSPAHMDKRQDKASWLG